MVASNLIKSFGTLSILLTTLVISDTHEASIKDDLFLTSMTKRSGDCHSACSQDKYMCLNNPAIQDFSDKFICLEQHRICVKKCNLGKRSMLPPSMHSNMAGDSKQQSLDDALLDKLLMDDDVTEANSRNTFLRQIYERMPKELLIDLLMNKERQKQA